MITRSVYNQKYDEITREITQIQLQMNAPTFYHAVIATSGETGFMHEMSGVVEAKMQLNTTMDYCIFYDNLRELVINGYKKIGGDFDPEKHRVVFRALSRLQ